MAPLTGYRHWFSPPVQLRASSWMLMTGSFGMLASTLPVQWLLPWLGWRGIFLATGAWLVLSMLAIVAWVPQDAPPGDAGAQQSDQGGYAQVCRHPVFRAMAPIGFFIYGGMISIQTLWAGPWLTQVGGWSAAQATQGLFLVNTW